MKVFISGSADITTIPRDAKNAIDNIIATYPNAIFLVGDCKGTDTIIQTYLAAKHYPFIVYHVGSEPRNCLPSANAVIKVNAYGKYGRDFYTQKDIQMTIDCDICIAIWNGHSKGTKANIDRAYARNKPVYIYDTRR